MESYERWSGFDIIKNASNRSIVLVFRVIKRQIRVIAGGEIIATRSKIKPHLEEEVEE